MLPQIGLNLIASGIGLATLLLAPGSAARMGFYPEFNELNVFEKIIHNAPTLVAVNFGSDGLCGIITAVFIIVIFNSYKRLPALSVCAGVAAGLYTYALTRNEQILETWWFLTIFFIPLAAVLIYTLVDYLKNGEVDNFLYVWLAVAMQCAMSISPEYGPRTLTITLLLLAIPLARRIIEQPSPALFGALGAGVFALMPYEPEFPVIFMIILLVGAIISLLFTKIVRFSLAPMIALTLALAQFSTVPAGYAANLEALTLNREHVEAFDPETDDYLILYYLPADYHRWTMPYDNSYHQMMYLRLHGLPDKTLIYYEILHYNETGTQ